jgi:hypothetical protein
VRSPTHVNRPKAPKALYALGFWRMWQSMFFGQNRMDICTMGKALTLAS